MHVSPGSGSRHARLASWLKLCPAPVLRRVARSQSANSCTHEWPRWALTNLNLTRTPRSPEELLLFQLKRAVPRTRAHCKLRIPRAIGRQSIAVGGMHTIVPTPTSEDGHTQKAQAEASGSTPAHGPVPSGHLVRRPGPASRAYDVADALLYAQPVTSAAFGVDSLLHVCPGERPPGSPFRNVGAGAQWAQGTGTIQSERVPLPPPPSTALVQWSHLARFSCSDTARDQMKVA